MTSTSSGGRSGRLAGRVAVVTGAAQGLGRAFALSLHAEDASVVVADLNRDRAESVCAELGTDRALAVEVDVSAADSVQRLREAALAKFGTVDVLVNNAAIFSTLTMRPFDEIPIAEWDQVMAVNVRGAFLCAQQFAPVMRRSGYGKIINISSATVFLGRPLYLHYVTSKAAIIGMTRALASELGPFGITVNAIAPGATETEIPRATVTPVQAEQIISRQAIKRREVPADLVGALIFLAGPESDFITGQTLNVDGGSAFH